MPNSMAQMVQVIAALANIQQQKAELEFRQKSLDQNQKQFAQQMGFQEKSDEFKKFSELQKIFTDTTHEAQVAGEDLAHQLFPHDPQMADAFIKFALARPQGVQALTASQADQGVNNPNASPFQKEVASVALTGQNQGQLAQSGLIAQLAGSQQATAQDKRNYLERTATGRDPLTTLIQSTIASNPDMRGRMAGITAGTAMTSSQAAGANVASREATVAETNAQTEQGRLELGYRTLDQTAIDSAMSVTERLVAATQLKMVTPQMRMEAWGKIIELNKQIYDPKAPQSMRVKAMQQYNSLIQLAAPGQTDLLWGSQGGPPEATLMERMRNSLGPTMPQPGTVLPFPGAGAQQPQQPPPNPLSPFLPKPPQ